MADLAAALEQLTVALAPGPVMPTLLAGLLLRGHAGLPAARELLPALAAGQASVAVALDTGTVTGTRLPDGTLRVSGDTGPVPGGGATSHLLLGAATGAFLLSRCLSIAGGTSQILLSVVAERALGLPRDEAR